MCEQRSESIERVCVCVCVRVCVLINNARGLGDYWLCTLDGRATPVDMPRPRGPGSWRRASAAAAAVHAAEFTAHLLNSSVNGRIEIHYVRSELTEQQPF